MQEKTTRNPSSELLEQTRWTKIIILLSMDVVIAFYDLMGLKIVHQEKFVDFLRSFIIKTREEYSATPNKEIRPFSPERMLDAMALTLGSDVSKHVFWWGKYIFEYTTQDHIELEAWTTTLRYCRHDPALWEKLQLPSKLNYDTLREFLSSIDTEEYNERHKQAYEKSLSDWDLHMYVINQFDDEDEGAPNGPDSFVYPTITAYQGYRFWSWILKQYSAQEQTALLRSASSIIKNLGHLSFIDHLVHPSTLEIGL